MNNFVQKLGAIALSGVLLTAAVPKRAEATTAVLLPVGAVAATIVVVGGITMWLVTYANGEQLYFNYEDLLPTSYGEPGHLEDPEGDTEEWSDRIWATNDRQAGERCRAYAARNGVVYVRHRQLGGNAYECVVRNYRN